MRWTRRVALLLVLVVAAGLAWRYRDRVPWPGPVMSPHEAYAASLERAGLGDRALVRAWREAAQRALDRPFEATVGFVEVVAFPAEAPHAVGYSVTLARGQRARLTVEPEGEDPAPLFVDLFESGEQERRRVASAERGARELEYEVRRGGAHLLRVQPELLAGGRVRITLRVSGALQFPVGGDPRPPVQSHFGDLRDGGRRAHHGIDIFAPRGAPVIAAAAGVVSRVETTGLGGRVVWVWDVARLQSHYYAHLDEQRVSAGQVLSAGETLGTVGNTGNARTTPPHLHFGIYALGEGPIDPFPFVAELAPPPPPGATARERVGSWGRIARRAAPLRSGMTAGSPVSATLAPGTLVRLLGAVGRFQRVAPSTGEAGYVDADVVTPADHPAFTLERERLSPAEPRGD